MGDSFLVRIKNYQILRDARLEFIPGLNVIVGESNNGKSAVLRAIETAVFNLSRPDHVKLGETVSAVGIKYNGHEIIWKRDIDKASQVSYKVDGKVYLKLGRNTPEIVSDALGIREIELDDSKVRLNFQKQMAFPFLLDKTPSQMFKFIVKSSEEDNLMEVVDAMKKDLGEINVNIKQYESSRESLGQAARREIDRFRAKKGSIPICDKVLEQELKVKKLVVLENLIKSCDSCLKVISESNEKLKIIDRKVDMLSETVEAVSDRLDKVVKLRDEISDLEVRDKECAVVSGSLSEVLLGIDKFKGLDLVKAKFGDIEKLHGSFDKMKELVTRLVNLNDDSLKVSEELKGIEDKLVKLKGLDLLVKRLQDSEGLSSILTKVNGFVSSEVQYSKELKGLHLEIEEVGKKLKEFNFCPFCHSKLGECSHE